MQEQSNQQIYLDYQQQQQKLQQIGKQQLEQQYSSPNNSYGLNSMQPMVQKSFFTKVVLIFALMQLGSLFWLGFTQLRMNQMNDEYKRDHPYPTNTNSNFSQNKDTPSELELIVQNLNQQLDIQKQLFDLKFKILQDQFNMFTSQINTQLQDLNLNMSKQVTTTAVKVFQDQLDSKSSKITDQITILQTLIKEQQLANQAVDNSLNSLKKSSFLLGPFICTSWAWLISKPQGGIIYKVPTTQEALVQLKSKSIITLTLNAHCYAQNLGFTGTFCINNSPIRGEPYWYTFSIFKKEEWIPLSFVQETILEPGKYLFEFCISAGNIDSSTQNYNLSVNGVGFTVKVQEI